MHVQRLQPRFSFASPALFFPLGRMDEGMAVRRKDKEHAAKAPIAR